MYEHKRSNCWKSFSVHDRKLDEEKPKWFEKFVLCKYYYMTYSSSTRNMNKNIQVCDGFNPSQTHSIPSTGINSLSLIDTLISSPSSSSNNKNFQSQTKNELTYIYTFIYNKWKSSGIR